MIRGEVKLWQDINLLLVPLFTNRKDCFLSDTEFSDGYFIVLSLMWTLLIFISALNNYKVCKLSF